MDSVINAVIDKIGAGGPAVGWLLAAYLLFRLHQLTDRQHKANLRTVSALAAIRTFLFARAGLFDDEEGTTDEL